MKTRNDRKAILMNIIASPSNANGDVMSLLGILLTYIADVLPVLVALWVAWDSKRFNSRQRKKDIKIKYCEQYADTCINLKKCIEELENASFELIQYMDDSTENIEKHKRFEVLRKQMITISNGAVFNSGMVKKLFPYVQFIDWHALAIEYGLTLQSILVDFSQKLQKEKPQERRKYIDTCYGAVSKDIADLSVDVLRKLTNCINQVQDEILQL